MAIINITADSFGGFIEAASPVLVDFTADWCGPCRRMGQVLEEVEQAEPSLAIGKVDVDAQPQLASAYVVRSIPTLVLFAGGEAVHRWTGVHPADEILEQVRQQNGRTGEGNGMYTNYTPEAYSGLAAESMLLPVSPMIPAEPYGVNAADPAMPMEKSLHPLAGMYYDTTFLPGEYFGMDQPFGTL